MRQRLGRIHDRLAAYPAYPSDRDAIAVIDIMTPEDYRACHIAGARNACVYEMAFLDRMEDLYWIARRHS
jgi:rhodanese-related sulfurtransferase